MLLHCSNLLEVREKYFLQILWECFSRMFLSTPFLISSKSSMLLTSCSGLHFDIQSSICLHCWNLVVLHFDDEVFDVFRHGWLGVKSQLLTYLSSLCVYFLSCSRIVFRLFVLPDEGNICPYCLYIVLLAVSSFNPDVFQIYSKVKSRKAKCGLNGLRVLFRIVL